MATIEQDIIDWVKTRPVWQQNLIARIARDNEIDDDWIAATAQGIVDGSIKITEPALTLADMPTSAAVGSKIELRSIGSLVGINALREGQTLGFGPGLTAIYGDNGSGKSGYARLAKELVGARHHEAILPNAYLATATSQSATIEYAVDGIVKSGTWPTLTDQDLRGVHFYDEACGDDYLATETELAYRPSVLKIFDRLIEISDQVRDAIDDLIVSNQGSASALPTLTPGTKASAFLGGLSGKTTIAQVDEATALDSDADAQHGELLQEEARLKSTDPNKEKTRLHTAAINLEGLADHFDAIERTLSPEAGALVIKQLSDARELRAAATAASSAGFADEPVKGVGSEAWRALWDAAKRFSEEDAYPGREFPAVEATDHCVLCQQPLHEDGADRLSRFHKFVHNDIENQAKSAENAFATSIQRLKDLVLSTTETTAALAFMVAEDRPKARQLQAAIEKAQEAKDRLASRLKGQTEEELIALDVVAVQPLRDLATDVNKRALDIDDTAFKKALADTTSAKNELADKIQLAKSKTALSQEVTRLAAAAKLKAARTSVSTAPMTTKSSELTRKYVTQAVSDRFVRESERLKLDHVVLGDQGGIKGKLRQKPTLLGAASGAPTDVLSEGEQTAAGLAGLFTEINFDDTKSAVVLDDPVSSLDHERRDKTAKRVAELAKDRQVIVFTHDLMFLGEIVKAASEAGVALTERSIERNGDGVPGSVIDGYPWKAKDAQQRLNDLQTRLHQLKKDKAGLGAEEYELRSSDWAGRLSETWERLVRSEVVNQVVDRGTTEVRPKMFRLLARITQEDDDDFQAGYSEVSKWARRHDKSEEVSYTAPSIEDLQKELDRAVAWRKRMTGYKQP
jgi:hypothetical protein